MSREGQITYVITSKGSEYAERGRTGAPLQRAIRTVQEYNLQIREDLHQRLFSMDPYRFEHLVADLLTAMDYQDVTVTKQSGDSGIDVVATVQAGITTVKEVIQVKRYRGTIGLSVLNQLRGALPLYGAIRGTIVTTGKFSNSAMKHAFFEGAAPITLIDGERLLDLLIENEIGIRKREIPLYELDDDAFERDEEIIEDAEDEE